MQAITIAIGKNGIQFFIDQYLKKTLLDLLDKMNPPDYATTVPDFSATDPFSSPFQTITDQYSNINIRLSHGSFSQFAPAYTSATQGTSGNTAVFTLQFGAGPFGVTYQWLETYDMDKDFQPGGVRQALADIPAFSNQLTYAESFQGMSIQAVVQFTFDTQKNEWVFNVLHTAATTQGAVSNIPSGSVVHKNDAPCQTNHLIAATQAAIEALNFSVATQSMLTGIVQTIPGSGDLGNGMAYDFSIGDSGILFPNNDGIQMGVKGGASYQGEPFAGGGTPSLPLPPPLTDADSHHLNLFVSDSEIAALCWCFFKAGKLDLLIGPGDLPDPSALKVSQYIALEPTLRPYTAFAMQAKITQNTPPAPAFRTAYQFSGAVMEQLKTSLPVEVFQQIQVLGGSAFGSAQALEAALQSAGVAASWYGTLEQASAEKALVLDQDLTLSLDIQNGQPVLPNIQFRVQRTDILNGLALGIGANQRQTLQFGFANADNSATFISSTVPGFSGVQFETAVWPLVAEAHYMENLDSLGKTGVPLPIMEGFQFDFDHAAITMEQGYVSILANLIYKNQ